MTEHGARLSVDIAALAHNWRELAARSRGAACAGVVKADAYGCGIEIAVPALARAGCATFFVAHLSEARRARAAAPEADIYVLNGLPPGSAPAYARDRLRPVLGSLEEIAEWMTAHPTGGAPAALHVDTGLNRLGLSSADVTQLPARFRPSLLISHFVASEVPDDPTTARQIERFAVLKRQFDGVPSSLCNSSGIFLQVQPSIHHDMVRPGVALYGANPTPWTRNPMRPVVRLDALIVQVRTVEPGESIGYNSTWIAPSRRRIAIVSLGYADGYHRTGSATNTRAGGAAVIDGVRCPLVARVSMDLITLDVTDAPGAVRGGTAQFLGPDITIDDVAGHLGTNAYEVLTSLGRRYHRVAVTG